MRQLFSMLVLTAMCAAFGQQPSSQRNPSKKSPSPATRSHFSCPDPTAKAACESYSEMLNAKDNDLSSEGYVCFRPNIDEFFTVAFSYPNLRPDHAGIGWLKTYRNGVGDPTRMPYLMFTGYWTTFGKILTSDEINGQREPDDHRGTVSVNDSVVTVWDYRYKNAGGDEVSYSLTIQRSTRRFAESYTMVKPQMPPLLEGTGRCIWLGLSEPPWSH